MLLISTVRGCKETRLPQQPLGATIAFSVQSLDEQLLVPIDTLTLTSQLIVKPHHFGDEARWQVKGGGRPRREARERRGVENHLLFAWGQKGERLGQARVEDLV